MARNAERRQPLSREEPELDPKFAARPCYAPLSEFDEPLWLRKGLRVADCCDSPLAMLGAQRKESQRVPYNVSTQNENVRFVQSRNVRFHGWPRAPWKRS